MKLKALLFDLQVNWMGTSVFVFYICAFGFYLWIRITKTLDLGQYLPYGIFVLFVECMGATTVVLYGTNLLWNPVNEIVLQESEDGIGPGKLKVIMHWQDSNFLVAYQSRCLVSQLDFDSVLLLLPSANQWANLLLLHRRNYDELSIATSSVR